MNEENEEESQDWGHISTIIWANLSTENIVVEFHKQDSLTIDKVLSEERYDSYRLAHIISEKIDNLQSILIIIKKDIGKE